MVVVVALVVVIVAVVLVVSVFWMHFYHHLCSLSISIAFQPFQSMRLRRQTDRQTDGPTIRQTEGPKVDVIIVIAIVLNILSFCRGSSRIVIARFPMTYCFLRKLMRQTDTQTDKGMR